MHALACDRAALYRESDRPVPVEAARRFRSLVERRARREPLQHLLGWTEFWSLRIACSPAALIPRPETELCVAAALERLTGLHAPRIADVGTGTGCIAAALALERTDAAIFATDVCPDALALAAQNVRAHGVADRVRLLQGDLFAPIIEAGLAGALDLVVCNPPYVAEDEFPALQSEVREYDPRRALDGGPDGLRIIRRVVAEAPTLLKPAGALILELGEGQAAAAQSLAESAGLADVETRRDAAGVTRTIIATRSADG